MHLYNSMQAHTQQYLLRKAQRPTRHEKPTLMSPIIQEINEQVARDAETLMSRLLLHMEGIEFVVDLFSHEQTA